jgi:hypothetical protein
MRIRSWQKIIACAALCSACGSSGGLGHPVSEFPSAEALDEFADEGVNPLPPYQTVEVSEWQLQAPGQPPDAANQTLSDQLEKALTGRNQGTVSPALNCAARETARFYADHQAFPDSALQGYLSLRCGSSVEALRVSALGRELVQGESDEEALASLSGQLGETIDPMRGGPSTLLGIGFASSSGHVAVALVSGDSQAKLAHFTPLVEGDSYTLTGRTRVAADTLVGVVTHGATGVRLCQPDRSLRLPDFRLVCPIAADDQQARLSVMVTERGRVLMTTVAEALLVRSNEAGLQYQASSVGTVTATNDDAAFRTALVEGLNAVRSEAGLKPLKLEPNQSTVNKRVVGQFFKNSISGDNQSADLIALGVMAGWNVRGAIKTGGLIPGMVAQGNSPARFLGLLLNDPAGRWVLLEPDISSVAVGARVLKPTGMTALITTYAFFDSLDHAADEDAVFEQLARVRTQNGLSAPTRLRASEVQQTLSKVATGASTTEEALPEAMQGVSQRLQSGVTGYVLETNTLNYLTFPDEFLQPEPLNVAVGVTHYKAPGAAWAQYALIFIKLEQGTNRNTARILPSPRAAGHAAM